MALAPNPQQLVQRHIQIGDATVVVDIADTEGLREQGLSGRASLAEGQGMLFVFPEDNTQGFWMKDMRFSIDIIWLSADGKVVTIKPDASPDSYPEVFYPTAPVRYALEVPAGFAARHGVILSTIVKL